MELRRYLVCAYRSECARCGQEIFTLPSGFVHDLRCWGIRAALHNLGICFGAALGWWKIAETEDD